VLWLSKPAEPVEYVGLVRFGSGQTALGCPQLPPAQGPEQQRNRMRKAFFDNSLRSTGEMQPGESSGNGAWIDAMSTRRNFAWGHSPSGV